MVMILFEFSDYLGLEWVAINAIQPAVASMSLGGPFNNAANTAVENLIEDGIVVSVAAGNSNADACNFSPASAPNVRIFLFLYCYFFVSFLLDHEPVLIIGKDLLVDSLVNYLYCTKRI